MTTNFDWQLDPPVNFDDEPEDDGAEEAYADYLDAFEDRCSGEKPVSFAEFCARAKTAPAPVPAADFDADDDIPF